ncbi:glycoside hydrolase family 15 protein [Dyadobacter luticola]|nr:glycoside hydrolase family 15 protein [Dyadobacter luticola]
MKQPQIASLAVISDRHTCALLDRDGTISWYCPGAFDQPALLSSLIDIDKGGFWDIEADGKKFEERHFEGRSSVLYTTFSTDQGAFTLTDFMPLQAAFKGICRMTSPAQVRLTSHICLRADYGLADAGLSVFSNHIIEIKSSKQWLHCSHKLILEGDNITCEIPAGEESWFALIDSDQIDRETFDEALKTTLEKWEEIEAYVKYEGPFEKEVYSSLRALQQLVFEPTGGIIAAPTIALPEVIGGSRNYDYRYVWMRDAALITSSLVGLETNGEMERKFMSFVAGAKKKNRQSHVQCFYGIDQTIRMDARELPLSGYQGSVPVMAGNTAAGQFQLDAESSILLACNAIYQKYDCKIEWDTVETIADYICRNWERKDNGIWEEEQQQHYTSSKAFAARALEVMAAYQPDQQLADRWLHNARLIREFINKHCITSYGAYAVYAGSEDVDITCALFAPFEFDAPDSSLMQNTIAEIEARYRDGDLYRRHLLEFDSAKEGVFLAASCWVAHYYALAGNLGKSKTILDAMLGCANDLGYFSEEMDLKTGKMLGNFPQTFVHSSFICAVNGYKAAFAELPA